MSRQSDNSKAGSEGNGDSILSSYQNSPRKTPEFGSAGPFGDHCTETKSPNCYILMMNNDSSPESEDQLACDLKAEYLERLNVIREKLASIDIANYGTYYKSCYDYSSSCSPRCQITEIFEESPKATENNSIININYEKVTKSLDVKSSTDEETVDKIGEYKLVQDLDNINLLQKDERSNKHDYAESGISLVKNILENKQELPYENVTSNQDPKNTSAVENILQVIDTNVKGSLTECEPNLDTISKNVELETIFKYDNLYNVESSLDLIDLNYNPPKKKYCIRETSPKITMSDGAMLLPYHARVGLHSESPSKSNKEPITLFKSINVTDRVKINTENLKNVHIVRNDFSDDKNNHIFPEVQVDCFGGGDQEEITTRSSEGILNFMDKKGVDSPRKSPGTDNEYNVFFFETVEQSPSESIKSHKTIVTETTVTTDSPSRNPKRRRLLLRSAQNKVKPIDTISLWEEIRTMEALNKTKQEGSSSSLESYFKDVIVYKNRAEPQIDLVSVGSLDVPSKTKAPTKFPSITRITKFCSSIFRKKSKTIKDEQGQSSENLNENVENQSKIKKRVILQIPKAAHTLLNVRKKQDLDVDFDRQTLPGENFSEYSSVPEEDDSYYEGICQGCFCF